MAAGVCCRRLPPVVGLDERGESGADQEDRGQHEVGDPVVTARAKNSLRTQGAKDAKHLEQRFADMSCSSFGLYAQLRFYIEGTTNLEI